MISEPDHAVPRNPGPFHAAQGTLGGTRDLRHPTAMKRSRIAVGEPVRLVPFSGPRIGQYRVNAYRLGHELIRHSAALAWRKEWLDVHKQEQPDHMWGGLTFQGMHEFLFKL